MRSLRLRFCHGETICQPAGEAWSQELRLGRAEPQCNRATFATELEYRVGYERAEGAELASPGKRASPLATSAKRVLMGPKIS